MQDIQDYIDEEIKRLQQLRTECKKYISDPTPGSLFNRNKDGANHYYIKKTIAGKRYSQYIGTETDERVGEHILSRINLGRVKRLNNNIDVLASARDHLQDYSSDAIMASLGKTYQNYFWRFPPNAISLGSLDEAGSVNGTSPQTFNSEYHDFDRAVFACDGTRVRSKGECIWYDSLKSYGIPFDYEPVLMMDDSYGVPRKVAPDFYIYRSNNKHMIVEHLGMLEDENYAKSLLWKLVIYHGNHYDLGHDLIMTCDDIDQGIDAHTINVIIKSLIIPQL